MTLVGEGSITSTKMHSNSPTKIIAAYVFYNPDTKQAYVGSTKDALYREKKHLQALKNNRHPNYKFQLAYNRNPNFIFMYVHMNTRDEATEAEQKLIDEFYGLPFFLNISNDARYCSVSHSEESRLKMSLSHKGKKRTSEAIEKTRLANIGHKRNLGRKHSEETRKKISLISTGRTHVVSAEAREVMRQKKLGRVLSDKHKKKLSEVAIGRKDSPEAVRNKHLGNLYRSRKVIIDGIKYNSLGMASKAIGLTKTAIANRINRGFYEVINE